MEYIQMLFLKVQDFMRKEPTIDELLVELNSEPVEYRSIAFESASFGLAIEDLTKGSDLDLWEKFYFDFGKIHSFHFEIGLGWAFAKTKKLPKNEWKRSHPLFRRMVFDGIGYYHALYKGRKTVKNQTIIEGVEGIDLDCFDQGIGRRLWYIAKGNVENLMQLIEPFPINRHSNLWLGIGIASGYVGGLNQQTMNLLSVNAEKNLKHLSTGIALAAISRKRSDTVNENIQQACKYFCQMDLNQIVDQEKNIVSQFTQIET